MKSRTVCLAIISLFAIAFVSPGVAHAKTYVVRQGSGSDSYPGTNEKPFSTLTKANSVIKPGDKVLVGRGVYASFTISTSNVVFESPNKDAVIDADGEQEYAIRIIGHHVKLKGFEITGSSASGLQVRDTHHITVVENYAHHNKGPGLYLWRSDFLKVVSNESAYNGGTRGAAGISIHSAKNHGPKSAQYNIEVIANYLHHNIMEAKGTEGWGLILDGVEPGIAGGYKTWYAYTGRTLVKDNYLDHNGKGGMLAHYAQNADFVHNATRSNAVDPWVGNGFEMGVRASKNIRLLNNNFVSSGGGPMNGDYIVYVWEGSIGVSRGNYTKEVGDPSNYGFLVDASSAATFPEDRALNHYGESGPWQIPSAWVAY